MTSYIRVTRRSERDRRPAYDLVDEDPYYSRPLVRRDSKRSRATLIDDDGADDYPWPSRSKPSRALTIRAPTQLERYNVFNNDDDHYRSSRHHHSRHHDSDSDKHRRKYKTTKKTTYIYPSASRDHHDDSGFDVSVRARYRPSSSSRDKASYWPSDLFKRREKIDRYDYESRERGHSEDYDDNWAYERSYRESRLKRRCTEEYVKPLSGFKHW